jgi:hypothetical protein
MNGTGAVAPHRLRFDLLALVPCMLFWSVFVWRSSFVIDGRRRFTLFDDAMISMRYGQSFADGHGLVWYPGAPKVEGYTNLLWTLVMGGLQALGLDGSASSLAIMLIGAAAMALTALLGARVVRQLGAQSRWASPITVVAIGLCYPLVFWTLRGMEAGIVTLCTVVAVTLAVSMRDGNRAAWSPEFIGLIGVCAIGALTRTDFIVVAAVVALWLGLATRTPRSWSLAAMLVASTVLVVGCHTLFRESYYGAALPNTYTLKMTGLSLQTRLGLGVRTSIDAVLLGFAAPLILTAVAWFGAGPARAHFRSTVALLLATVLGVGLYSTFVGGDAWEESELANRYVVAGLVLSLIAGVASADRIVATRRLDRTVARVALLAAFGVIAIAFLGPLVPGVVHSREDGRGTRTVLAIAFVLGISGLLLVASRRSARVWATTLFAVLALVPTIAIFSKAGTTWARHNAFHSSFDAGMVRYGEQLRDVTLPDARIAVVWAGAPAFYSERETVDLLGKNDPHIARVAPRGTYLGHNKWDYRYSIGRLRPDVVAQLWNATDAETRHLRAWGYVRVSTRTPDVRTFWVRDDSPNVRWERLERA